MAPRRGRSSDGAVRGPTSALTSFLAGLGVEAPAIQNPYARADEAAEGAEAEPSGSAVDEAGPSSSSYTPVAASRKRRRAASVDSDDLDADTGGGATSDDEATLAPTSGATTPAIPPSDLKPVGEFMLCGECGRKFPVTIYTKEHPRRPRTWLCTPCCRPLGIDPYAKPKKARGGARASGGGSGASTPRKKDERNKIVHYEVAKGAPLLSDMCIKLIGKYIEEVEALGDIGSVNMDKVCKIISKSRRLTPETATLFYSAERQELSMYDVTGLDHDAFVTLSQLCPNLTAINLQFCGQMVAETLQHWAKQLTRLRRIELYGPFLVRKPGWIDLFVARGAQLEGVSVTQSPRIDHEVAQVMVDNCPNLRELRLSEIGQLDSEFLVPLAQLTKLESLAITAPGSTPLNDDAVAELLEAVGANLTYLDLSENTELSDAILPAIAASCPRLTHLSLRHTDLSDEGVGKFFALLKAKRRPGLVHLDMEKGHELSSRALRAILAHSGKTLQWLSLVGWRHVPAADIEKVASSCPVLEYLDIGWCRHVTDFTVKDLLDGCDALKELRVWGCNELTNRVPRKRGVKVVGIETHAI